MKKLLAPTMVLAMALVFTACGGRESISVASSTTTSQVKEAEFTPEQQALAQEFLDAAVAFDKIADRVNVSDELRSDEELVTSMNELAGEIIAADQYFSDPEKLTPEMMEALKVTIKAINEFAKVAGSALDEIDSAKTALQTQQEGKEDIALSDDGSNQSVEEGEGIGKSRPLTEDEMNYVISLRTESWLNLNSDQKNEVISLMARWWDVVDGYVVEDFDGVLGDLDHQMETYYRNKADEGLFQTACDIYGINVSHYIME